MLYLLLWIAPIKLFDFLFLPRFVCGLITSCCSFSASGSDYSDHSATPSPQSHLHQAGKLNVIRELSFCCLRLKSPHSLFIRHLSIPPKSSSGSLSVGTARLLQRSCLMLKLQIEHLSLFPSQRFDHFSKYISAFYS